VGSKSSFWGGKHSNLLSAAIEITIWSLHNSVWLFDLFSLLYLVK